MCTSIVSNRRKTLVGWNLDILGMEYRVTPSDSGVYIEIKDAVEGWMPLFGANSRGDFVAMPTCWPFNKRSDPGNTETYNIIRLNTDLLLGFRTWDETCHAVAGEKGVSSVPGVTFMSQLTDYFGNVLQIVPGEGYIEHRRPTYTVMTNFSPFNLDPQVHPWEGRDRYTTAEKMLSEASDDFDVADCFALLRACAQQACPTVVSMVFDVHDNTVYWCEKQQWDSVSVRKLAQQP